MASCTNRIDDYSETTIDTIIECIPSDTIKWEYDFILDEVVPDSVEGSIRVIHQAYPSHYGFTRLYKSEDGDFLDVFVIDTIAYSRGEKVALEPQFLILMRDNGEEDAKVLASKYPIDSTTLASHVNFLQSYSDDVIIIDSIVSLIDLQKISVIISSYSSNLAVNAK